MPLLRAISQKLNVLRPRPNVAGSTGARGSALEALATERAVHLLRRSGARGGADGGSTGAAHPPFGPQAPPEPAAEPSRAPSRPPEAHPIRAAATRAHPPPILTAADPVHEAPLTVAVPDLTDDWVAIAPAADVPPSPAPARPASVLRSPRRARASRPPSSRPASFAQRLSGDWVEITPSSAVFPPSSGSPAAAHAARDIAPLPPGAAPPAIASAIPALAQTAPPPLPAPPAQVAAPAPVAPPVARVVHRSAPPPRPPPPAQPLPPPPVAAHPMTTRSHPPTPERRDSDESILSVLDTFPTPPPLRFDPKKVHHADQDVHPYKMAAYTTNTYTAVIRTQTRFTAQGNSNR